MYHQSWLEGVNHSEINQANNDNLYRNLFKRYVPANVFPDAKREWGGGFVCLFLKVIQVFFTFTKIYSTFSSYNAIKAYKKEGKLESLSATEHLVSAAEAGELNTKKINVFF